MSAKQTTWVAHVVAFLVILVATTGSLLFALFLRGTAMLVLALSLALVAAVAMLGWLMDLAAQRSSNRFAMIAPLALVILFVSLTVLDVVTRTTFPPAVEVPPSATGLSGRVPAE